MQLVGFETVKNGSDQYAWRSLTEAELWAFGAHKNNVDSLMVTVMVVVYSSGYVVYMRYAWSWCTSDKTVTCKKRKSEWSQKIT